MTVFRRLWKPWIVYRPGRLARRALLAFRPSQPGYRTLETSWGAGIIADPSRTIGRSILSTGVYDLPVSETLARLISQGDTVVDVGANVGYMTVLMSVAAGQNGHVLSFEPHPDLFSILSQNVAAARKHLRIGTTELQQVALGDVSGTAQLILPPSFQFNDGIARIGSPPMAGGTSMTVRVETLDRVIGSRCVNVLKMDVEGFESHVLRGALRALEDRRLRNLVFEDHDIASSETGRILKDFGYEVFSLGWLMRGPVIEPLGAPSHSRKSKIRNYVATLDPKETAARFKPRRWEVLTAHFADRGA